MPGCGSVPILEDSAGFDLAGNVCVWGVWVLVFQHFQFQLWVTSQGTVGA